MSNKRYIIVKVNNSCPAMLDDFGCIVARNILHCKCGKDTKNYGDTKGQLIKKVAQVIRKRTDNGIIVRYREGSISVEELAKEIVEFLGVED